MQYRIKEMSIGSLAPSHRAVSVVMDNWTGLALEGLKRYPEPSTTLMISGCMEYIFCHLRY